MSHDIIKFKRNRIYFPVAESEGVHQNEAIRRYVEQEFPEVCGTSNACVYCIPDTFIERNERQASQAELIVFRRLAGLQIDVKTTCVNLKHCQNAVKLWVLFFHGASYAGHSQRNQRVGKLMVREHDFVMFSKFQGKHHVTLLEVKSTHDAASRYSENLIISDARVVKNNKRSAQHQLRDHFEILNKHLENAVNNLQCYIIWPFLGAYTRDPKHAVIRRWQEDGNLHVFEDVCQTQCTFNEWFQSNVLFSSKLLSENSFYKLLNRFVLLSCGIFVDEIHRGMLALLTQEQLKLLTTNNNKSNKFKEKNHIPLVVHGVAGTGKTLLILKKLQLLYEQGELNETKRALYICYWSGIRCDFHNKLKVLGIENYVDSARFYISQTGFLSQNKLKYRHIFVDEAEAICLAFEHTILIRTLSTIYQRFHDGNCLIRNCKYIGKQNYQNQKEYKNIFEKHDTYNWGQLWFLIDANKSYLFLPEHSPDILKSPRIVLNRVMRSTLNIFKVTSQFYSNSVAKLPRELFSKININNIKMGHNIAGPPIYWINSNSAHNSNQVLHNLVYLIIDLCATKGIKPNNLCVIPFLVNENFSPETINDEIAKHFVQNGFRPQAIGNVEQFVTKSAPNEFLISWAFRVKGLEFKIIIVVLEDNDFDVNDFDDRKKMYIMITRCTCLLILICSEDIKSGIDVNNDIKNYPFGLKF